MTLSLFHELSKDKLFEVMKNLVFTYNWAWFKGMQEAIEKYGSDAFLKEERTELLSLISTELLKEFGSRQSRKLVELSIVSGTDVDSIIKGLRFSYWALLENVELTKLSDSVARMRTIDCSLQRNARKKLGTEYPCKTFGFSLAARTGFVKAINPRAEVKCIFCPPDPRPKNIPENVSCEWIISIPS